MTVYYATIRHHSIGSVRTIGVNGTLSQAKRRATREFGGGFIDHEIVIYEGCDDYYPGDIVATRRIGSRKWRDRV